MWLSNYSIRSELGQGGMATVYLAEDKKFLTNVAVKVLAKEFAHNENIRKRFLAEARNMFRMSHPNIIKVTDLIEEGDTVAFVMEYIEGDTLKDYLERKGKLNDDEIKAIFTQMLSAVGYVHEQGLIHRDIKPSNFMISPKGQVKLLDFGIAKNTDTNSAEYTQTSTSQQMGTPMYMSPEQVNETKSVTAQSDIYSLGVVLWQMVMGQKPYDTKTLSNFQLQTKIVNEPLKKTNSMWDGQIQKACAKNMEYRFQNCNTWLRELNNPSSAYSSATSVEDDKTIIANKVNDDAMLVEQMLKKKSKSSTKVTNEQSRINKVKNEKINEVKTNYIKKMFVAPFKFKGRIRRTEYGISLLISLIISIITMGIGALITVPFLFAQGCKRCHDINKSGWFQLIPFFGLWMLFVEGDKKKNEYGLPPK